MDDDWCPLRLVERHLFQQGLEYQEGTEIEGRVQVRDGAAHGDHVDVVKLGRSFGEKVPHSVDE